MTTKETPALLLDSAVFVPPAAAAGATDLAAQLSQAKENLNKLLGHALSDAERSRILLDTKQRLFAELRRCLPPATSESQGSSSPSLSLRVVPDEHVSDPLRGTQTSGAARPYASLPLEDLVVFLELYDAAEHEDGRLLLQLLGELDRFLFYNMKHCLPEGIPTGKGAAKVKLPLPQLLFVLSRLGAVPDATLQGITGDERGIVFEQLHLYDENELLVLLVALHRFGLHNSKCMQRVIRCLQKRLYTPFSAASVFQKRMHQIESQMLSDSLDEALPRVLKRVARNLDDVLQCGLPLLLESQTAMAQTVFRRSDVVRFIANLTVATAFRDAREVKRDSGLNAVQKTQSFQALASCVLHAAKLTEQMSEPQPLLAETVSWCCSRSAKGVVVDGGEDADVPSDRRAYYDNVTADLIKVSRVF